MARIQIGDPQKIEGSGIGGTALGGYISYKVTVELTERLPGLDASSYTVIRRFSDFVWLRTQLREAHPFVIIPALPEKQQIGRFNQEFVDVRMRALQRWADRVGSIRQLTTTPAFKHFVSMPAGPFTALREGSRGDQLKGVAAEGKRVVLKALKTAKVLVQDAIAQARGGGGGGGGGGASAPAAGGAAAARTAEDASFRELEAYLLGGAPLVTALYNASAAHALRAREQAQLLLDFGAALRALGQTEGGALGDSLAAVGLAAWASSTAEYEAAVCATEALVERLADYVRLARAVRETLDARARASADLADALTHVERVKALATSLANSTAPSAAKERYAAEAELAEAQRVAAAARVEYDAAAAGVVAEAARGRAAMAADVRGMLVDWVTTLVRTELKLAAAWDKSALVTLPAVAAERGGLVGGGPGGGVPPSPGGISTVAF